MSLPVLPRQEEVAATISCAGQQRSATVVFRSGMELLVMPDRGRPPQRDPGAPVYRFRRSLRGWATDDPRIPDAQLQLGQRSPEDYA